MMPTRGRVMTRVINARLALGFAHQDPTTPGEQKSTQGADRDGDSARLMTPT
jgi:hypothetical protein